MDLVADKADGLRMIARDYVASDGVNSVNISGLSRKRILKRIEDASGLGDEALAALLPGILTDPLAEIGRVMEFDVHPSFALLCQEVGARVMGLCVAVIVHPQPLMELFFVLMTYRSLRSAQRRHLMNCPCHPCRSRIRGPKVVRDR